MAVEAVAFGRNVSLSLGNIVQILVTKLFTVKVKVFLVVFSEDVDFCMTIMFCIMGGSIQLSWWHDAQLKSVVWDMLLWEVTDVVGCEDDVSVPLVLK